MTDREALLHAVAANPEEDTPRLVYADLLDELGGEVGAARARFIRLQIDLVRNPGRSWFANADRLAEVSQLAGLYSARWLDELPKWARSDVSKQRLGADDFPRGFLDSFRVKPVTFAQRGNELLDVAPVTRLVAPGPIPPVDLAALLSSRFLLRIRSVSLLATDGDRAAATIKASWGALTAVEELDLAGSGLTDSGAASLSQAVTLSNLRVLVATGSQLTEDGVYRLLSSPRLPRLTEVRIGGAPNWWNWIHVLRSRFPGKRVIA